MMNMEIFDDFSGSNDQMIVKGKRTKRLRPSSSTSSSGGVAGGEFNCNYNYNYNYNSLVSSPATSSEISTSTEEDEDMANCLILLARGGFSPKDEIKPPENKLSSRKFTEMAATTNGKVGIYVYECKTCSRTFPSFQALGGHRASHKKPKAAADVDQRKPPPPTARRPEEDEEEERKTKLNKSNTVTPSTSAQLPNHAETKPKLHECSICGSEFASGQALGGHMRRHRSAINAAATKSGDESPPHDGGEKSRNLLELDLNLPAPPEDDRREPEFGQFASNQKPRHLFSAAALVDCHY